MPGEQMRSVLDISHTQERARLDPEVSVADGLRERTVEWFTPA